MIAVALTAIVVAIVIVLVAHGIANLGAGADGAER